MSLQNNILIVDDDSRLRSQLKRLIREVVNNWNILEADNYDNAIELINNYEDELNILVCDLFLSSSETKIKSEYFIPEGIKVAQQAKESNSNLFIIVVTSYLDSFLSNHQLIDYMETGVNAFFDRAVTPYEKFSDLFQYQLQIASDSIIFPDDSATKLWINLNIESCRSYWILVCDLNDQQQHDLIGACLIWEKTLSKPGASFLLVDIHDENKLPYLIDQSLIDDINDYPILLIGESPEMLSRIKIANRTLNIIQENSSITKFLNLIHTQLLYKNISDITNRMKLIKYWDWLNMNNIESFDLEQGLIKLCQERININISNPPSDSCKIIKIFLASSSELESDRREFEIFINRENNEYIKKNIFLELILWEDFIDAMSATRLQDQYNRAVEGCDIFISLFHLIGRQPG